MTPVDGAVAGFCGTPRHRAHRVPRLLALLEPVRYDTGVDLLDREVTGFPMHMR